MPIQSAAHLVFVWFALLSCMAGCSRGRHGDSPAPPDSSAAAETREFTVEGMTCEGCVSAVTAAVKAIPGVKSVQVSLKDKKATVSASVAQVPTQKIEEAIRKGGFKVQPMTVAPSPPSPVR